MILRLHNRGQRVVELQQLLRELGYFTHPTNTGNFGPVTQLAVIKFQKDNGLKDDGIVGPLTWRALTTQIQNNITPIYSTEDITEDFSDPEEEMVVGDIEETQPTCSNISELVNLINSSNITRNVTRLVFHCTATHQTATVEAIVRHWREKRRWKNPGYHIIVRADGSWTQLQDFNRVSNGVAGINSTSLHISYIGGIDKNGRAFDNRTDTQKEVFETVYHTFKTKMPHLTFHGHYEFSNKACPSYNVKNWIREIESSLEV
jgi:N-acetylmuramoyl-L-alanine amidase